MIYAIQAGAGGAIKFGVAGDPEQRRRELQTGNPAPLSLLAAVDLPAENESLFHRYLSDCRVRGEWFWPTGKAIALVEVMQSAGNVLEHIAGNGGPEQGLLTPRQVVAGVARPWVPSVKTPTQSPTLNWGDQVMVTAKLMTGWTGVGTVLYQIKDVVKVRKNDVPGPSAFFCKRDECEKVASRWKQILERQA